MSIIFKVLVSFFEYIDLSKIHDQLRLLRQLGTFRNFDIHYLLIWLSATCFL